MLLQVATVGALLAAAHAQVECSLSSKCKFDTAYNGQAVTIDFRQLCNPAGDYELSDGFGHTYFAQVCGLAAKSCLPYDWENQYEYGTVIQTWGDVPACNVTAPECVESRGGNPTCCTENCQVVAINTPTFSNLVDNDPSQGVQLTYLGEQPTQSDPYQCDYNPATQQPFPRVTHLQFFCDPKQIGFARLYEVDQNATDDCEYTLKFYTNLVCADYLTGAYATDLSGGWIFNIIFLVLAGVYVIGGYTWGFYKNRTWQFPHKAFWTEADALVWDGVRFLLNGCRPYARVKSRVDDSATVPAFSNSASGRDYTTVGSSSTSAPAAKSYSDL